MSYTSRIVAMLGIAAIVALARGEAVAAQLTGTRSGVLTFAPTDAAALGDSSLSSVGVSVGGLFTLGGGMGVGRGAIRGYIGAAPPVDEIDWLAAAGYARTLATRTLIGPLRGSIGRELDAGVRYYSRPSVNAGALSLAIPFGTTLGSPSGRSLGIYLAPYGEANLMHQVVSECTPYCTYRRAGLGLSGAFGAGVGVRASAGRVSVSAMEHDILDRGPRLLRGGGDLSLGLSIRLGR